MAKGPRPRYYNSRDWALEVGGVREQTLLKFIEYFELQAAASRAAPRSSRNANGIQEVTHSSFIVKGGLVSSIVKVRYVAKGNSPRDIRGHVRKATEHAGGNMPVVTPVSDKMTRLGIYYSKQDIERFGLTS